MSQPKAGNDDNNIAATDDADAAKAEAEKKQPTVSRPGGFDNDPDDATNPNEAIERARRKVRP